MKIEWGEDRNTKIKKKKLNMVITTKLKLNRQIAGIRDL